MGGAWKQEGEGKRGEGSRHTSWSEGAGRQARDRGEEAATLCAGNGAFQMGTTWGPVLSPQQGG